MAQVQDYNVADGNGLAVLAEINDIFGAVRDDNAGPTPPQNPVAFMRWRDTSATPSVLRIRNAANSEWLTAMSDLGIPGIGSTFTADNLNLNNVMVGGTYHFNGTTTGAPLAGFWGTVLHLPTSGTSWARQVAWTTGSERMFMRQKINDVWGAWVEVLMAPTATASLALGGGVTGSTDNDGSVAGSTYKPTPVGGNFKAINNNGAFTFTGPDAPGDYTLVVMITNVAGAGPVTLSWFSRVTGDSFTTTVNHRFLMFITRCNGQSFAHNQALQ